MTTDGTTPRLPEAPSVRRRLVVSRGHAIGQAVIVLIVVLALVGVLGNSHGLGRTGSDRVAVSVEYPTVLRYKTLGRLQVSIAVGASPLPDVWLVVSSPYLEGFSNVSLQPEPAFVTRDVTAIPLGRLEASEERVVQAELHADRYWGHEGRVEVRTGGEAIASIPLSTWVLP